MYKQSGEWYEKVAAPLEVRQQLDHFTRSLCEIEGDHLIGVYLHGSLALGCYQPGRSDLDLLVLVDEPPAPSQQRAWAQQLLSSSGAPAPIEISFLHRSQYSPWRHPAPFSFHFSEEWRERTEQALQTTPCPDWHWQPATDPDLAAHLTVTRQRGLRLAGAPVVEALPALPWSDYLDSIGADLAWASARAADNPVYLALNACRVLAAVEGGLVLSKIEGVHWARAQLPAELAAVAAQAAAIYTGAAATAQGEPLGADNALRLAQWVSERIGAASGAISPTR